MEPSVEAENDIKKIIYKVDREDVPETVLSFLKDQKRGGAMEHTSKDRKRLRVLEELKESQGSWHLVVQEENTEIRLVRG